MHAPQRMELTFSGLPEAFFSVDVISEQVVRPRVSGGEGICSANNHQLDGDGEEVALLPNGLDINMSKHYSRSVSDFEKFQHSNVFHLCHTRTFDVDVDVRDGGIAHKRYRTMRAAILDKRYHSVLEEWRATHPVKVPPRRNLFCQKTP